MKTFFLLLSLALTASAQNALVRYYPDNAPFTGLTNWPKVVALCSNNAAVPQGWDAVVSTNSLASAVAAKQATYDAGAAAVQTVQDNASRVNLARLLALYNQIPNGRTLVANDQTTLGTIEASLASATNTQAQVVIRVRQLNNVANDLATVQANILELLQRLGPVLQTLYRPEQDTTP